MKLLSLVWALLDEALNRVGVVSIYHNKYGGTNLIGLQLGLVGVEDADFISNAVLL